MPKFLTEEEIKIAKENNLPVDEYLNDLMKFVHKDQEGRCIACFPYNIRNKYIVCALCPEHYEEWSKDYKKFERKHWVEERDKDFDNF